MLILDALKESQREAITAHIYYKSPKSFITL